MEKRKARTSNKLKPTPSTQLETASQEELLEEERSFRRFAEKMNPSLLGMGKDQRDALLRDLHRISNFKTFLKEYTATERDEVRKNAQRFRKYRLWLAAVDKKLKAAMTAMNKVVGVANRNPGQNNKGELETLIIRKTLMAIVRAGKELGRTIELVQHIQYDLAAGVHPARRTRAEKKLVPEEAKGLEHTNLPLSEKTRKIDLWFMREAADILDKYRKKDGRPIPNHDQIIVDVFKRLLKNHCQSTADG
jgi:hypothetical protein